MVKNFECKNCGKRFESKSKLNKHFKTMHALDSLKRRMIMEGLEKENQLSELKLKVMSKISKVKEIEILRRNSCRCKTFCRIYHEKHNFIKSVGEKFERQFSHVNNVNSNLKGFLDL